MYITASKGYLLELAFREVGVGQVAVKEGRPREDALVQVDTHRAAVYQPAASQERILKVRVRKVTGRQVTAFKADTW